MKSCRSDAHCYVAGCGVDCHAMNFQPFAALFAGGAWTLAGAQTRDRILWRTCGDEGDARRGTVDALRSWHCAGGPECHNRNAARRSFGRSGAGGTRALQSSNRALEIRRLGRLRHGARRNARASGRYEPAIGWPLGCRRRDRDHGAIGHAGAVLIRDGVPYALGMLWLGRLGRRRRGCRRLRPCPFGVRATLPCSRQYP